MAGRHHRTPVYKELDGWSDERLAIVSYGWVWRALFDEHFRGKKGRRKVRREAAIRIDESEYRDLVTYRSAVRAHFERELSASWPFIDLPAVKVIVAVLITRRFLKLRETRDLRKDVAELAQLFNRGEDELIDLVGRSMHLPGPAAEPTAWTRARLDALLHRLRMETLPDIITVLQCPGAFTIPSADRLLYSAGIMSFREAVVRAVEFLWVKANWEKCCNEKLWGDAGVHVRAPPDSSRFFAVSYLAAGGPAATERVAPGETGWRVADAIALEERRIRHAMKVVAEERMTQAGGKPDPVRR